MSHHVLQSSATTQPRGPSADPAMWSGSYLAQLEAAEIALAKQWDDVDMAEAEYMARHEDYERASGTQDDITGRYLLTLDTNILINHLRLVQQVFQILSAPGSSASPLLLVPTVIIYELDNLAASRNYDPSASSTPSPTLARARQATSWLLSVNRHRRETGQGAIRCQRWSERGASSGARDMSKADDRVLDCCLFFKKAGAAGVMLWTEDRNLSLLVSCARHENLREAEANDIPTIPSPTPSLSAMMRICGIADFDPDMLDQLDFDSWKPPSEAQTHPESDDMQIESDLVIDIPPQHVPLSPTSSPLFTPSHQTSTASKTPSPPRQPSPPLPSRIPRYSSSPIPLIPTDILARLTDLVNSISGNIVNSTASDPIATDTTENDPPSSRSTIIALSRLIALLEMFGSALSARYPGTPIPTDITRLTYRLLAVSMTLRDWVRSSQTASTSASADLFSSTPSLTAGHRSTKKVMTAEAAVSLHGVLDSAQELGRILGWEEHDPFEWQRYRDLVKVIRAL